MQKIFTANIKNEKGRCTYTQMLNPDGGIEGDVTVVCLDRDHFRIVSAANTRERDKFHINKYLKEDKLKDVTEEYCVLGVYGPKSRDLLKKLSNTNFSNEKFKFATGKEMKINSKKIWIQRISYVGEVGYELYINVDDAKEIYETLMGMEKEFNISNCGVHAMDIMRMESGFVHWGQDI